MNLPHSLSRRALLGSAALLASARPGCADAAVIAGETAHFWYRGQPAGKYIDSQRGHNAFAYAPGKVFFSDDNGRTWPYAAEFPEASGITFSHFLKNGNILFATGSALFLSTDKLRTLRRITVKAEDGSDYLPHTPKNPDLPGWYFHTLPGIVSWDVDGREMMVWGNYCNVVGGATPVNIYYSTDSGRTVKIAYSFGQNPFFTDNGKPGGGQNGAVLGNPKNPVLARHVHSVAYNPAENAFYACTGDGTRSWGPECHWMRGVYDAERDRWNWKVLVSTPSNSRFKSGGIVFADSKLYFISDSNGPEPYDRGIFRCDAADLTNPDRHERLFNPGVESANMIIEDGVILASHCAPASPLANGFIVSADMGKSWAQYDLKEFGSRSPVRFHEKNGEGWFRADLRKGWIDRADVIFLKPKPRPGGSAVK